ncbi:MAG: hypothetical protein P0120_14820 [Nitrospira sp.]|nr:hypothetical protein [Nitrospira sp.]
MIRHDAAMATSVSNQRKSSSLNLGKISLVVGIALANGAFFHYNLGRFLSLTAMKENRDSLLVFQDANFSVAVGMLIGVYAIVVYKRIAAKLA